MIYQFRCPVHGDFTISQGMMEEHTAICPKCSQPAERVFLPLMHYWPDVLFDSYGRKQSPDILPHVPSGTKWTHGWSPKESR